MRAPAIRRPAPATYFTARSIVHHRSVTKPWHQLLAKPLSARVPDVRKLKLWPRRRTTWKRSMSEHPFFDDAGDELGDKLTAALELQPWERP